MGVYYEKGGEMPWSKGKIGEIDVRYIAVSSKSGETSQQAFEAVCRVDAAITQAVASGELVMIQKDGQLGHTLVLRKLVDYYVERGWTVVPQE